MIKRLSTSIIGAFAITFFLFLGMYFLIAPEEVKKATLKPHGLIVLGGVEDATETRTRIRPPEETFDPVEPIDIPRLPKNKTEKTTLSYNNPPPPVTTNRVTPKTFGIAEGDFQPLRKFAPAYPRTQAKNGTEGYVIVKFTITKMGSVENVTVVESTNRAFERPSIRAVEKYKYKPRVIDGVAVEVQDVMEKISFEMEKS